MVGFHGWSKGLKQYALEVNGRVSGMDGFTQSFVGNVTTERSKQENADVKFCILTGCLPQTPAQAFKLSRDNAAKRSQTRDLDYVSKTRN